MMNDTYDDKDDTAYTETMNHGKSSQKKGESSRDKKRSGSDAQRKSGGRDRGGSKSGKNSTQKRMVPATSADVSPARVHQTKKKKAVSLLYPFAQAAKAGPSSPNRFAPLQSEQEEGLRLAEDTPSIGLQRNNADDSQLRSQRALLHNWLARARTSTREENLRRRRPGPHPNSPNTLTHLTPASPGRQENGRRRFSTHRRVRGPTMTRHHPIPQTCIPHLNQNEEIPSVSSSPTGVCERPGSF